MRFQIGDQVVHPIHGVVTVQGFSEQRFAGDTTRQYCQVATASLTVWVPLDDHGTSILRRIASKDTLAEGRRLLKSRAAALDKDRRVRQLELTNRLKGASLTVLVEIVRDLTALGARQPLSKSEHALLKKALKSLGDEWAAADGVTVPAAIEEIESLLQNAPYSRSR